MLSGRRKLTFSLLAAILAAVALVSGCTSSSETSTPPKPANPELIMASTTSTGDSGLMDVLLPIFEQKTGYQVKPIYVGSGATLAMGEKGEADVLLVHAPASEVTFMNAGHGTVRKLVMHNDYVIVGPSSDPAGIKGMTVAADAFKKIADAGETFISRGDDSGTNKMEISIWAKANVDPKGKSWYQSSGQGMGATLTIASEKAGYTLTDRATYLATKANLSLDILMEGDAVLLNIYHVIQVNPNKSSKVNAEGAKAFADFMVSPETQKMIGEYGVDKYGAPLFFPDAGKTEADLGSV